MGCFHLFDGPSDHLALSIAVPPTKVAALRLQPSWTKEHQGLLRDEYTPCVFVHCPAGVYYDGAEPGVLDGQTRGAR